MVVIKLSCSDWVRGSVIGVGAFGTVSLAMDKVTGELLAVKSIECKEERKGDLLAMENEISILKKLDSPWIVKYLGESYSEDGGVCRRNLLMEYVAGGSVADNLQRFGGPLEESVIRIYVRDILRGIEYLHRQGIVHSDIKGKNVLVGDSGVKLADFGSAKVMSNERESGKVEVSGTLLWMAPEVVNQVERGPPCDIWSLGCTIVEMATGRPPWTDISHPLAAMYKIGCTDELPEFPKALSPEGHYFLQKCFHRDPKKRWTSTQLLTHPFISERVPKSPKSTLDFPFGQYQLDMSISSETLFASIPPLSLPGDVPSHTEEEEMGQSHGQAKRMFEASPSPHQRIAKLAEKSGGGRKKTSGNRPKKGMTLASSWIVVRCRKNDTPPMVDSLFSDFINGSLVHYNAKSQCSELKSFHCQHLDAGHDDKIGNCLNSNMCIQFHCMNRPSSSSSVSNSIPKNNFNNVVIRDRRNSLSRFRSKLLKICRTPCIINISEAVLQSMLKTWLSQNCTRSETWCKLCTCNFCIYAIKCCHVRSFVCNCRLIISFNKYLFLFAWFSMDWCLALENSPVIRFLAEKRLKTSKQR